MKVAADHVHAFAHVAVQWSSSTIFVEGVWTLRVSGLGLEDVHFPLVEQGVIVPGIVGKYLMSAPGVGMGGRKTSPPSIKQR